jgi:hypothetical protein
VSTGVFRQYPTPRIPAPKVTQGQPLGSPIGATIVPAWSREARTTQLIPLGIAALIPVVVATYVPQPVLAVPARAASAPVQALPDLLAPLLAQQLPSAPPVLWNARAAYPVQLPAMLGAALIPAPVVSTYVGPSPLAAVPRTPAGVTQVQGAMVAPYLTQNTPDAPLPISIVTVSRAAPPNTYLLATGLAPLVPAQAAQYVPPAALPRFNVSPSWSVPAASPRVLAASAPATFLPKWSVPFPARADYQMQQLRAWLVQGVAAPVVLLPISGQSPSMSGASDATVSGPGDATVNGAGDSTVFG